MIQNKDRVCPVELAGSLDTRFRRWLQNPRKILNSYIKEGMTALDIGCGPGFFTIDMALMVGESGHVIAADLQQGMLQKVRDKISGTEFESRVILHKSGADKIGLSQQVDFALAFYMVHEVPDKAEFFKEVAAALEPQGQLLVVEPPFHVSKSEWEQTVSLARDAGLTPMRPPKMLFNRTGLFKKKA